MEENKYEYEYQNLSENEYKNGLVDKFNENSMKNSLNNSAYKNLNMSDLKLDNIDEYDKLTNNFGRKKSFSYKTSKLSNIISSILTIKLNGIKHFNKLQYKDSSNCFKEVS